MNTIIKEYLDFVNDTNLNIEGEIWKNHPIFTNYYASNLGRIKYYNKQQKKELIKKQYARPVTNNLMITIYYNHFDCKTLYVPKFILECFQGINDELFTMHIDGNYFNNKIENLIYTTKNDIQNNIKKEKNKQKKKQNTINENDIIIENEIWKKHPILNIECSNKGRIKCIKQNGNYNITRGRKDINGYCRISLNKKTYQVHRLIAETFLDNIENKPYVNHIDANPSNNDLINLEWCTPRENCMSEVTYNKQAHKIKSIDDEGNEIIYKSLKDAYRHGYSEISIINCIKGIQNKHKRLKWKYVE